jgi:hypothetical protein
MKLSEKTLELNICAQCSAAVRLRYDPYIPRYIPPPLWFGLTQKQEARAGFDACTKLNGRLLVFQFKASNLKLQSGERRFLLPHDQLIALQRLAGHRRTRRSMFVAFPLVGTTAELQNSPDLLDETWLLDVASLRNIGPPNRKNGCHNVYVSPGSIVLRSERVEGEAVLLSELIDGLPDAGIDTSELRGLPEDEDTPYPSAGAKVLALLIPR